MADTAAARLVSTEDVVLEILRRVSTDAVSLFRCAVACKRWRALVADRSFLRRCWPEKASTLLGLFSRQRVHADVRKSYRLFFVPLPAGSVLGTQRRLLTSMVEGVPDDESNFPEPLVARRGLLVLRLVNLIRHHESVHMAVCDPFAGTCRVLPPLECRVRSISCTVLTGAECGQHQRRSSLDCFKVLAVVTFCNPKNSDDQECNLYTFSSTESRWSAPTKLFNEIYRFGKRGFSFPAGTNGGDAVVCGTMVHWLVPYFSGHVGEPPKYYTLDVSADGTCHTSLTELPVPANQLIFGRPTLRVTADGSLSLFCIYDGGADIWRLHVWQRRNDCQVWLHTRAIDLILPRQPSDLCDVRILPVEKSDTLIMIDQSQSIIKIHLQTGEVEEHQFQNALSFLAIPMHIEWPTLFASRLG